MTKLRTHTWVHRPKASMVKMVRTECHSAGYPTHFRHLAEVPTLRMQSS